MTRGSPAEVTVPKAGLRELFPSVNCGATVKAEVSNQRAPTLKYRQSLGGFMC